MTVALMRASPEQRTRLKAEEGLKLTSYRDTVGKWTIGVGHAETNPRVVRGMRIVYQKDDEGRELLDPITKKLIPVIGENGRPMLEFYQGKVCEGVQITGDEADRLLEDDLDETERGICEVLHHQPPQHQFDALCDFCHQYGLHNFVTSTLLIKMNFNPFSPAVLDEFMRWTRAGGEHQEYVWRRSARRSILYNGSPVPQKLWSKCAPKGDGFPFSVTTDDAGHDVIDYTVTPTLQRLIDIGKNKAAPYVFDPSKIEMAPGDSTEPAGKLEGVGGSIPAQEQDTASAATAGPPEGVGDQGLPSPTASPIAPPPDKTVYVTPDPASVESKVPAGAPVPPPTSPKPPAGPVQSPPVIAGVDGAKPKSPWTVQPEEVHYKIDPTAGLKPLDDSDRAKAFVWQRVSMLVIYIGAAGCFGNTFKGGSELLMKHSAIMSIILDLWVPVAVSLTTMAFGVCAKSYGDWKRHRAEQCASQGLY